MPLCKDLPGKLLQLPKPSENYCLVKWLSGKCGTDFRNCQKCHKNEAWWMRHFGSPYSLVGVGDARLRDGLPGFIPWQTLADSNWKCSSYQGTSMAFFLMEKFLGTPFKVCDRDCSSKRTWFMKSQCMNEVNQAYTGMHCVFQVEVPRIVRMIHNRRFLS